MGRNTASCSAGQAARARSSAPTIVRMSLLVRSLTHESAGVLSVELVDPGGAALPPWEPGAHLDLQLPGGLSRQYSLSGDPADRSRYRLGVLREDAGRGGSAYVHDTLRPGHHVEVDGPRNHFRLEPAASYVFVAGVDVLHDCQEGICGSCEVKVIEGEVDHRDHVLSEPERAANGCMMVCVSRACGKRLVLGV